ncbi:LysE/ArgO family amino acid transporter [Celerinatantimonas yamalensis]|uniref:LysE/ArgO family amino acid transporter n=1 Tax=Celerinatantimonas yamalensis TaxID=559956 RepID=A0ABW9G7H2_9GAMM
MGTFIQGYLLMLGLIMPIGMQNAFVLSQGIHRQHHYLVATICTLADLFLVSLSVYGLGSLLTRHPLLEKLFILAGCIFLLYYAMVCLRRAWRASYPSSAEPAQQRQRRQVIMATLGITLLNPHVYLDTLLIWGSYAVGIPAHARPWLIIGGVSASLCWFFLLASAGAYLAPWLSRPRTQQLLNIVIALVVLILAMQLLAHLY